MTSSQNPPRGDVGVVGLGAIGGGLAQNLTRRGRRVVGFDLDPERARALAPGGVEAAASLAELAGALRRPRRLVVLVPAGPPVDAVVEALEPLCERGDILIDGGNSRFTDTDRRMRSPASRGWHFVGMGISGGPEGALEGPSLMPGGPPDLWPALRPLLESIAAQGEGGPCVAWCGRGSAGHFVKMVHNGIEYAEMQHLAEATRLLRDGLGMPAGEVADVFDTWNQGELESFLLGLTARILRVPDPEQEGRLLLDAVQDRARQLGTGRWTVLAALDLGVAVPSIAAAVEARLLSSAHELRERAEEALGPVVRGALEGVGLEDVRGALLASRIAAYTQGFALLAAASGEYDYGTELAEVARIWEAGCIIRARLLRDARRALGRAPDELLLLSPDLAPSLRRDLPGWRRVVASAARAGFAAPGLTASLAWYDTLTTARGSGALLQAQRDAFGGHGYERVDAPGRQLHSPWKARS